MTESVFSTATSERVYSISKNEYGLFQASYRPIDQKDHYIIGDGDRHVVVNAITGNQAMRSGQPSMDWTENGKWDCVRRGLYSTFEIALEIINAHKGA